MMPFGGGGRERAVEGEEPGGEPRGREREEHWSPREWAPATATTCGEEAETRVAPLPARTTNRAWQGVGDGGGRVASPPAWQ